jgi:hypothetical protein
MWSDVGQTAEVDEEDEWAEGCARGAFRDHLGSAHLLDQDRKTTVSES